MSGISLDLGKRGETQAADFLRKNGYKILALNYKSKLGEIDCIAKERDTICFVEVKTRSSERFGFPSEAVSAGKQKQISRAAVAFLKEKGMLDRKARFDVVSVVYSEAGPKIDLIKDAFELSGGFTF